jgi:hypothetical protein
MEFYKLETTNLMDNPSDYVEVEDNDMQIITYPMNGDLTFMLGKVGKNYKYYMQASPSLKRDQRDGDILANVAVHSCIQYEKYHSPDIITAHKKVIIFTDAVEEASGLVIQTLIRKTNDEESIIYSVDKPKSKVLEFNRRVKEFREISDSDNYWGNDKAA